MVALSNSSGVNGFDASPIFDEIGDSYNSTAYTDSNGDNLFFEKEYWNATEKTAFVWVKVPTISNTTNTTINLWFTKFADGSSYHVPANVWDNNYVMVQHMNDNSTSTILDSTSNNNDGTKKAANEPLEATGKIGKGQDFDATDDNIALTYVDPNNNWTVSLWVKDSVTNPYENAFSWANPLNDNSQISLCTRTADNRPQFRVRDDGGTYRVTIAGTVWTATDYNHVTVVKDGNDWILYVNGSPIGSPTTWAMAGLTTSRMDIGSFQRPTTTGFESGILDEIQFSYGVSGTRGSAWVAASYETQKDNLFTYGTIQTYDTAISALTFGLLALIIAVFAFIFVISKK